MTVDVEIFAIGTGSVFSAKTIPCNHQESAHFKNDVSHTGFENGYRNCQRRKKKNFLCNVVYGLGGKKYVFLFTSDGKKLVLCQLIVSVFHFSSSSRCTFSNSGVETSQL